MKIVIVGDGKVGYNIAKQLLAEGHDIVVIDNNPDVLEDSLQKLDVLVVDGNGVTLKTQEEADVANSDLLIAATSADEINLLCCILAKKLGCRHAICRMSNPAMFSRFSICATISPFDDRQSGTHRRKRDIPYLAVPELPQARYFCQRPRRNS